LQAVARAEVGRRGDDRPIDLAKGMHRGEEPPGVGPRFSLAVLVSGLGLGGVEFVGRRADRYPVVAVDDGDQRVDVAPGMCSGRREGCGQR
jgi:hypothetical protein